MTFNIETKYYPSIIFILLLIGLNFWMLITRAQPWFISALTIPFHEAGHAIFALAGNQTLTVLGGTLMELLVPAAFVFYFYSQYKQSGEIFSWWWLSIALYSVSIYVADARAQVLTLIGGPGGHDWFYLLGKWRLLDSDQLISKILVIGVWIITGIMLLLLVKYIRGLQGRIIS